jgi:hypothetical protein
LDGEEKYMSILGHNNLSKIEQTTKFLKWWQDTKNRLKEGDEIDIPEVKMVLGFSVDSIPFINLAVPINQKDWRNNIISAYASQVYGPSDKTEGENALTKKFSLFQPNKTLELNTNDTPLEICCKTEGAKVPIYLLPKIETPISTSFKPAEMLVTFGSIYDNRAKIKHSETAKDYTDYHGIFTTNVGKSIFQKGKEAYKKAKDYVKKKRVERADKASAKADKDLEVRKKEVEIAQRRADQAEGRAAKKKAQSEKTTLKNSSKIGSDYDENDMGDDENPEDDLLGYKIGCHDSDDEEKRRYMMENRHKHHHKKVKHYSSKFGYHNSEEDSSDPDSENDDSGIEEAKYYSNDESPFLTNGEEEAPAKEPAEDVSPEETNTYVIDLNDLDSKIEKKAGGGSRSKFKSKDPSILSGFPRKRQFPTVPEINNKIDYNSNYKKNILEKLGEQLKEPMAHSQKEPSLIKIQVIDDGEKINNTVGKHKLSYNIVSNDTEKLQNGKFKIIFLEPDEAVHGKQNLTQFIDTFQKTNISDLNVGERNKEGDTIKLRLVGGEIDLKTGRVLLKDKERKATVQSAFRSTNNPHNIYVLLNSEL